VLVADGDPIARSGLVHLIHPHPLLRVRIAGELKQRAVLAQLEPAANGGETERPNGARKPPRAAPPKANRAATQ
jgi:hypothetical protein